jgi:hypothetical protein
MVKLTKKSATAETTETLKDNKTKKIIAEEVKTEVVPIVLDGVQGEALLAPAQVCEVGFEASYTHNLGDFKSARVNVSLKVPCTHAEIDSVFDYAKTWVDTRLGALVSDLQNGS